ncbi:cell surface protein [Shewanella sp. VB17]|uniref:Hint domain-containing protein n=1 Tax=Shewanella sp. VB17 TaxID=2739432 RepID=UPI0015651532|nr:Hint domain-containing protein [Shewanella sp. VB17]NRD75320.1 cell surface protein [Shewanella sp. VB17]
MKFTQYNTFLAASVLTLCSFTSLNAVAADAPDLFKRCAQDSLNPAQARGRDLWAKTCKYISQRDYDYLLYDDDGKLRARPKYPSFFKPNDFSQWFRAPIVSGSSCSVGIYTHVVNCVSSCYTPDQKLLFAEGEFTIFDAVSQKIQRIVTLSDAAELNNLAYTVKDVEAYSESITDIVHDIRVLNMASGGQLKVTENHPLLVSTGHMKTADNISVGESLIYQDGNYDVITSIDDIDFYGKVYNVQPDASDASLNGQIVVAQGYLSGSMYYQNEGADLTNRLLLRSNIPDSLL